MKSLQSLFKRQLIGLDIGISGIKAVEISGVKTPRLMAYNRIPLPRDTITAEGEIKNRERLVESLKLLFSSGGFSSKQVAVGAFARTIITKKVTVQKMSEAELSDQLYWEAEQYIPYNVNEVNLDFAVLGPNTHSASSQGPMMDVLIVAAKKDVVSSLKSLIEEAGLIPSVIDSQSFALGNVFEFNYGHLLGEVSELSAYMIVDFGAGSTKVSLVEGDKTTFTRELQQSGIMCTDFLAQNLKMSWDEAESLKLNAGTEPRVTACLEEFSARLADEIARTLDYYLGQSSDRSIQGVYTCGGGSRLFGLQEALEAKLPAPVEPLNAIQNIAGSGRKMNAAAIRELSYLGAVGIGLSLRRTGDAA